MLWPAIYNFNNSLTTNTKQENKNTTALHKHSQEYDSCSESQVFINGIY